MTEYCDIYIYIYDNEYNLTITKLYGDKFEMYDILIKIWWAVSALKLIYANTIMERDKIRLKSIDQLRINRH